MDSNSPPSGFDGDPREAEWHTQSVSDDEQHSEVIIRTVATLTNQDPRYMTPIAEVLDVEPIDRIFGSETQYAPKSVTFEFEECDIVVEQDHVYVRVDCS